ncbi:hypothetical protein PENSUB_3807 [Penicillium subrubescens]|uniref:Uncharacterized protein n=1 Tax=Penicillium subrubescens TaxID=1316194 RepID=A0A1Q5UDG7_9EURO|nr:hypothetical protein PENSUB_3807 [Penicillium subrubescens]
MSALNRPCTPQASLHGAWRHNRLSDGTWSRIETGTARQDHGPFLASMGMSSSVNDMLAFMAAVMNQYDQESLPNGFVATAYVFLEAHTAIVALSNAAIAGDAAETASRIMLQSLFKFKPRISTLQPRRDARDRCLNAYGRMVAEWRLHRDVARFTGAS